MPPWAQAAAVARRLERNGDRTDWTWPPVPGTEVGHVEVSLYGATVRITLHQVRDLIKQQRPQCNGEKLKRMGLSGACREAVRRIGPRRLTGED